MKGIIIVPCWRRPDFLWACLSCLRNADGIEDYDVWVRIDRSALAAVHDVARFWQSEFYDASHANGTRLRICDPGEHPYPGNSYNVLTAYMEAVEYVHGTDALIHLVEEDVFVSKGYLRFHEAAHRADPHCFAVSACRDQNHRTRTLDLLTGPPPAQVLVARPTYQSLGVSFREPVLCDITQWTSSQGGLFDYFADPVGYCRRAFPSSTIPAGNCEQDGYIGRWLEHAAQIEENTTQMGLAVGGNGIINGRMLYPVVPRAFHAGFVGYNRSGGLPLYEPTPEAGGRRLLAMSQDEMNERADGRFRDIERCDLERTDPADLELTVLR